MVEVREELLGEGEQIQVRTKSKYTLDESVLNHELRRKLWEGQIPLKIDLALGDLNSLEQPRSLYLMAPRENYFYFILQDVKSLFDAYGPPDKLESYDEMWFSFDGQDLKWNLPIGVQFDTAVGLQRKKEEIPWCLTFHYRDNPNKAHIYFKGIKKSYQFNFINALKESHFLRMGDANEILSGLTSKDEKKMLEDGLFKNNYETFWEINSPHLVKHIADLKRYAVRVLSNTHHTFVQLNFKLPEKPVGPDGNAVTENSPEFKTWLDATNGIMLGDLLVQAFPNLFDESLPDDADGNLKIEPKNADMEVLTHGVKVDLNTNMYWLQMNFSYLDGFVYLSFYMPTKN